jgi:hypothetical protein
MQTSWQNLERVGKVLETSGRRLGWVLLDTISPLVDLTYHPGADQRCGSPLSQALHSKVRSKDTVLLSQDMMPTVVVCREGMVVLTSGVHRDSINNLRTTATTHNTIRANTNNRLVPPLKDALTHSFLYPQLVHLSLFLLIFCP